MAYITAAILLGIHLVDLYKFLIAVGDTLYQASLTRFHISLTIEGILFHISFFETLQTFSVRFLFGLFPWQASNGTSLASRKDQVCWFDMGIYPALICIFSSEIPDIHM